MSAVKYPGFRWYVMSTMLIAAVAQGIALISPAPLVGELSAQLGLSLGQVTGATMGAFIFFVAAGGVVGGIVVDRIGVPKTYIGSLFLLLVGTLLIPFIGKTIFGLIIARIIQGCGAGPIMSTISKIAAEWFKKSERGIMTGIQGMGVSLGVAIGFGASPAIYTATSSWRVALAWPAIGCAIAFVMSIVFLFGPRPPQFSTAKNSAEKQESDRVFKQSVRLPVFWIGLFSCFFLSWVMQGYNDLTPGHISVAPPVGLGYGAAMAGKYMGLMQLAFMLGSFSSGFITLKLLKGKSRSAVSVSFLLTGIFACSVLLTPVHTNPGLLLLCLILAGFFMGFPMPTVQAFISNVYPEHVTGRVGGITMGLSIFGGVVGVATGSLALHMTERYTLSVLFVAVVCLVGAINGLGLKVPECFAVHPQPQAQRDEVLIDPEVELN